MRTIQCILEDISSIRVVLKNLNLFSGFSGLRINFTKSEKAGMDILESVALCRMKCLDLTKECIKVLDVPISYNKNFKTIKNVVTR